jgi:hypothetical protein
MPEPSKFATLHNAHRVWAVASIHGEARRLDAVHEQIAERFEPGDRLVYLGNYLGHGKEICETLDQLLSFRRLLLSGRGMLACDIVFLRGAQEEMWAKLILIHQALNPGEVLEWMLERGLRETLEAYGGNADNGLVRTRNGAVELVRWTSGLREAMHAHPGHSKLMSALRRAAFTKDGSLLFVSAGIEAARPLDTQGDSLWWGDGFDKITEPYSSFKMIVRGYDRKQGGVRFTAHTASIDGGCGSGGPLQAACFDMSGACVEQLEG